MTKASPERVTAGENPKMAGAAAAAKPKRVAPRSRANSKEKVLLNAAGAKEAKGAAAKNGGKTGWDTVSSNSSEIAAPIIVNTKQQKAKANKQQKSQSKLTQKQEIPSARSKEVQSKKAEKKDLTEPPVEKKKIIDLWGAPEGAVKEESSEPAESLWDVMNAFAPLEIAGPKEMSTSPTHDGENRPKGSSPGKVRKSSPVRCGKKTKDKTASKACPANKTALTAKVTPLSKPLPSTKSCFPKATVTNSTVVAPPKKNPTSAREEPTLLSVTPVKVEASKTSKKVARMITPPPKVEAVKATVSPEVVSTPAVSVPEGEQTCPSPQKQTQKSPELVDVLNCWGASPAQEAKPKEVSSSPKGAPFEKAAHNGDCNNIDCAYDSSNSRLKVKT